MAILQENKKISKATPPGGGGELKIFPSQGKKNSSTFLIGYDKEKKFRSHPWKKHFREAPLEKKISKGLTQEKN